MTERHPRLLIVGLDRYTLDACVRLGVAAVVVCGAASWDDGLITIPSELSVLRVDDQSNVEAVLMALRRAGLGADDFDALHTSDEYSMVSASILARHLGLPCLDPEAAVRFRDKSLQKAAVRDAGLPAARCVVVEDVLSVSGLEELPFEPAVLKPVAGAATALTSVVENVDDLRAQSEEYGRKKISQRTFVLEEYVAGDEWFVDGIVHGGELLFCAVGAYGDPCLTAIQSGKPLWLRHFDPVGESWVYEKAQGFVESALGALGLQDGSFHMELFHDRSSGVLTFGECGARRGGALIHEQIQAKFGVNIAECAVQIALGRRPEIEAKVRPEVFGGTYLPGRPGTLLDCPTPADLLALPYVEFVRIEHPVGTHFAAGPANTSQRVGQFMVVADSIEQLTERFEDVRRWFDERLWVLPEELPTRGRRDFQREWRPTADFRDTLWR
ncbi:MULTISPECIES: ATP-grasp domain-containing protein [Streptosporangium]|uniref:Biotin carboxylase n=1 Tax=Streptosporangium brasiliense TaxID=47480 RepID=A0ABT9RIZ0_9ACTN|nr:ATP-grasp domain-containing protein [Streptosporangium brasiliense]MDP9869259.1 biotin carboxylase [Streptosporangium brasiliense]